MGRDSGDLSVGLAAAGESSGNCPSVGGYWNFALRLLPKLPEDDDDEADSSDEFERWRRACRIFFMSVLLTLLCRLGGDGGALQQGSSMAAIEWCREATELFHRDDE